jgi:hypothetical protein
MVCVDGTGARFAMWRRAMASVLSIVLAALALFGGAAAIPAHAAAGDDAIAATTKAYVEEFYPLWFTYYQSQYATRNRLVGPVRVSPLYQIVVAINVDTIYASTFVDVTDEPLVLSVPVTAGAYSVLNLDLYGNIFDSGIPSQSADESLPAATYALTSPTYAGGLPAGVIPIRMPFDVTTLIFRADRHTPEGQDQTAQADEFRSSLRMQTLCEYQHLPCPDDPSRVPGDRTLVVPEILCAVPFKTAADALVKFDPIEFLKQLQFAVGSSQTPPMTLEQQALSNEFDALFGDGDPDERSRVSFVAGAHAAHKAILDSYLNHLGPTNWIHFTNIGDWGDHVVERAAITEFLQYGNGIATAAYYHAFRDRDGVSLDGSGGAGYVLHFAADEIPTAERFWSITAYTPQSVELVRNSAEKYVVARYTPGLHYENDGSLNVYLGVKPPADAPEANWLPVPDGPFNIMLRVYGVEAGSSVADDTYVPPGIELVRGRSVRVPSSSRTRLPFERR